MSQYSLRCPKCDCVPQVCRCTWAEVLEFLESKGIRFLWYATEVDRERAKALAKQFGWGESLGGEVR